ncbi:uncharacterized protein LOC132051928 isoform X1 [Lycium ferocissimum]|uniref:uncharacterized protein LOC132051928 isoform X1 n=1 Tax=Lycium ferocissimum TaxID=112874 RepID=UPI002814B931|nr:uncharacterized protein LOC132051928 isoform X1 [Lycium ferocissimum]
MSKQVLDSVDSLSLPSEPPHIGNWFSSYAYESPVLSGIDDLKDTDGSRKIDAGDGRKRKIDDNSLLCGENVASQGDIELPFKVWRASDNLSFSSAISEPLDTKDCFSSYVPETPLSADSDDFRVPESIDIGFNEDTSSRGCKAGINSKEEYNSAENRTNVKSDSLSSGFNAALKGLVQCTNFVADNKRVVQDVDSSDDISLASEPPDIRNWFSSYVYESPNVDTIQDSILPDHEKELDDKVYSGFGEPQNSRNSLGTGFIHNEHRPVSKDLDADGTNNTGVSNEMSLERISQHTPYYKTMQNSKCGSPRYSDMVIEDSKTAGDNSETMSPQETNCKVSCIINHSSSEGEKLYRHAIHRKDSAENSSKSEDIVEPADDVEFKSSSETSVLSQKLSKRQAEEMMDKENHINDLQENGFRSTRKGRNNQVHKESPLPRPAAVQSPLSGVTVASNCHKHGLTRKVLAETTNLNPSVLETTGKWRCPQRTKPNLGPPLKQLRLEQWVRRA